MTTFRILLLCWIFFLLSEEVRSHILQDAEVAGHFNEKDQYADRDLGNKHLAQARNYTCTFESNICKFLTNDPKNKAKWRIGQGGMDGTGPSVDHTFGNSTGKYLYVNFQEAKNDAVTLLGPDMSADYCINFWHYTFGDNGGLLLVNVQSKEIKTWYFYKTSVPDDQWKETEFCVKYDKEVMGSSYKIAFIARCGWWTDGIGAIALDDIVFSTDNAYEDFSEMPVSSQTATVSIATNISTTETTTTDIWFTKVPTTEARTTEVPTTKIGTTELPTTRFRTTKAPTTEIWTTKIPTTELRTTEVPTTKIRPTELSTTGFRTTKAPTTEIWTTKIPTTELRTTEAPTTKIRTTELPTTGFRTTEAPTTRIRTTEEPTTELRTTEVPTTKITTTELPTTRFRTTEAPTTRIRTTEEPTTEIRTTEEPTTEIRTTEATTRPTSTKSPWELFSFRKIKLEDSESEGGTYENKPKNGLSHYFKIKQRILEILNFDSKGSHGEND